MTYLTPTNPQEALSLVSLVGMGPTQRSIDCKHPQRRCNNLAAAEPTTTTTTTNTTTPLTTGGCTPRGRGGRTAPRGLPGHHLKCPGPSGLRHFTQLAQYTHTPPTVGTFSHSSALPQSRVRVCARVRRTELRLSSFFPAMETQI